ncbi:fumarylacetoacetate hydrolase family protein [bacterium]|nr:fumarylacetoacetate hydrolase family protein [bacterium]
MRIYRYRVGKADYYGELVDGTLLRRCVRLSADRFELKHAGPEEPLAEVELLPPVKPSKIVCVGRNYADHAKEMGNAPVEERPLIFLKPPSCLIPSGGTIVRPAGCERVDYEGEIALVIGRECRQVSEAEAFDCLLGITAFNDVTERTWQKGDGQWTRGKGCDTFGPCGAFIDTTAAEALRAGGEERTPLEVTTRLNGEQVQHGSIADLTFGLAFLISYLSRYMTLCAGDIIATGTPAGVGPLSAGDTVTVELSNGVELVNSVKDA